jgi:hypothetical protein
MERQKPAAQPDTVNSSHYIITINHVVKKHQVPVTKERSPRPRQHSSGRHSISPSAE